MHSIEIQDIRTFMGKLFTTECFDSFLAVEGDVTTFCRFKIDGTRMQDFFDTDPLAESGADPFVPWGLLRPRFFALIKGKRSPLSLRLTLKLNRKDTIAFLSGSHLPLKAEEVSGLLLNIHFSSHSLTITSGISLTVFTLDKSAEHLWDDYVCAFLKKNLLC